MNNTNKDFVKLGKCRFCGGMTDEILISKTLKAIPDEQAYSGNPCKECEKRFKTHKYFIGECGHNGFIKTEALKHILKPKDFKNLGKRPIYRTDKCPVCAGFFPKKTLTKNAI